MDWANSDKLLPPMPICDAAYAANMIATRTRRIPYPLGFQHEAPSTVGNYKYAIQKQMQTLQAAYASCATVAIVETMLELNHLMEAEALELHAACKEEEGLEGTRTPRVASITLLVYTTSSSDPMRLLDAMAMLASAPNERNQRAAETARFAFLVGQSAVQYAAGVSKKAIHTTSKARAPGQGLNGSGVGAELCVRWADIVPAPAEYADADCVDIRTEFEDIPHCSSAAAYVLAFRTALRKVWNNSNFHFEGRVLETYSSQDVDGSYEAACTEVAQSFHAKLCPPTDVHLSNDTKDADFSGSLMHSGMYVRLVPRDCKDVYNRDNLAHQRAYYGLLLHQRPLTTEQLNEQQVLTATDWSRMARAFCTNIKEEEQKCIFGLREPQTQDERAIALHILSAKMEWVDFESSVSVYGQGGVPGRIFDKRFGAKVVHLVRKLVPLDKKLKDDYWLLPCSRPIRSNEEHAQYSLLMERLCDAMNEHSDVVEPVTSNKQDLQPFAASWPQVDLHVTTEEQRRTRQLLGVALNSPVLRIGDAEQAVSAEHGPTAVVSMLSAMAHVLSPDLSVEEGMQFATTLLRKQPSTSGNKHLREEEETTDNAAKMPCTCSKEDGLSINGLRTVMAGLGVEWSRPAMTFKKTGPVCDRALSALRKVVDVSFGTKGRASKEKQGELNPQDVDDDGIQGDIKRIAITIALSLQHSETFTHGVIMMTNLPNSASVMEFAIVDELAELKQLSPVALMNMNSSKTGFVGYSGSTRRVDACLRKTSI